MIYNNRCKRNIIRWKEYVDLFFQNRPRQVSIILDKGFDKMKEKMSNILKSTKPRKATDKDKVPSELLKLLNDDGLDMLVNLFNTIYQERFRKNGYLYFYYIA